MADYIPSNDGAFDTFFVFLVQYVTAKCIDSTWTHIPAAARTELTNARNAWTTAYTNVKGPHTPVDTKAKNDAKKAATALLRPFVNQYLRFLPVTDEDRMAMGIHNKDPHPSPVQPPKHGPTYTVGQAGPATLGVVYRDGDKGKKGSKPKGMTGAEIHYGVFAEPPRNQEDLPGMVWATKVPHDIHFREADRGKRAWFALKWGTRREKCESPWSEMQSEVVP
jgi:hypothetical protein